MSADARKDMLVTLMAAATGITVIWANQAKERPTYPYAVLNFASEFEVGSGDVRHEMLEREPEEVEEPEEPPEEPEEEEEEEDLRYVATSVRHDDEITLSINTLAKPESSTSAFQAMRLIRFALARPAVLTQLRSVGLAIADIGPSRDMSAAADGGILLRQQMDVMLNAATLQGPPADEQGDFIEKVEGEITLSELERVVDINVDASGA